MAAEAAYIAVQDWAPEPQKSATDTQITLNAITIVLLKVTKVAFKACNKTFYNANGTQISRRLELRTICPNRMSYDLGKWQVLSTD